MNEIPIVILILTRPSFEKLIEILLIVRSYFWNNLVQKKALAANSITEWCDLRRDE